MGRIAIGFLMAFGAQCWAQDPGGTPTPAAQVQSADDTAAPAQNGPTPQYTNVDMPQSLNFVGDAAENSTLRLGAAAGYLFQSAEKGNDTNYFLLGPRIGITSLHPKLALNLSYVGNLNLHTSSNLPNYYGQNAGVDILYQLSPHWQAHAADHYIYTADPFESYFARSGPPLPDQPNPAVYIPTLRTEQNVGELDLSDRLTAHDTLTFNGTQFLRRYQNYSGTTTPLYNVLSYGGGANFVHQFSPQWSLGGGYSFSSMDFSHGQQRSGVSTIKIIVSYQISPSMSISGFAGPSYVAAKDTFVFFGYYFVFHQSSWTPAVGVNYAWRTAKSALTVAYARQTSDGGGLLATTNYSVVKAAYMRQLTRKWRGTLGTEYVDNQSFTTNQLTHGPKRTYSFWNSQLLAERKISNAWRLDLRYAYVHSNYDNIGVVGHRTATYNAVAATLNYNWTHPLGR